MHRFHCLVGVFAFCALGATVAGQELAVRDNVDAQASKYKERLREFQVKVTKSHEIFGAKEKKEKYHTAHYKRNGPWRLFVFEEKDRGRCRAINGQYAFELSRGKNGWELSEIDTNLKDGKTQIWYINEAMPDETFAMGCSPYALAGSGTLMKLMGRSGFSITKVEKVTAGGEELTKIWFKVAPDEVSTKHTGAIPIEGGPGWLLLDPNCWWRIREFLMPFHSTKYDSRFNAVAKYSYEMADGGFPLVKQMDVTHSDLASGKPIGRAIREFTFEKRVASEDEFKLSAFGLPEPKITRPPSWWSYPVVWFSVIAFTCILLVFLIRWHKRRTAEPEGQPT